jgi:maleate isomerase
MGVSVHTARMPLEDVTADNLDTMAERAIECVDLLSHADVDVIAYACTTGSLLHGSGFDMELEEEIEATANCPAVATALSVKRLLDTCGYERIVLATPYIEDLTQREVDYLTESGYEIVAADSRNIEKNTDIGALTPKNAYQQAKTTVTAANNPDVVFISCTNYPSLSTIEQLERDLGLPVITSNRATLWDALRMAGVNTRELRDQFSGLDG